MSGTNFNLADGFYRQVLRQPERMALWLDGRRYSYVEIAKLSYQVAQWLVEESSQRVGIMGDRSLESISGILGACWAGAAFVPLNASFSESLLAKQIKKARVDALIVDAAGRGILSESLAAHCPRRILYPKDLDGSLSVKPPQPIESGSLAYLMFTTGSTGEPKAVAVSAGSVRHYLNTMNDSYCLTPDDRLSQFFRLTFDLSVFDLFMSWENGAGCYVIPEQERLSPAKFIQDHELTVWFSTPSLIAGMKRKKFLEPGLWPSLRLSLFCGEPLPDSSARAWAAAAPNSRVENLYGPAEATVTCLRQVYNGHAMIPPECDIVAIGLPNTGMAAAIINPSGEFMPLGTAGELALAGPQLALGYWDDEEQTAARFINSGDRRRWYRTGDFCRQDSSGIFHFLGRVDRQIKIYGNRFELEGIEALLRKASGSEDVAAVAWPPGQNPEGLIAFIASQGIDDKAIMAQLARELPPALIPLRIVVADKLPLNSNGKIDYAALMAGLE
ncbi:MAG: hypothetical protein A3J74_09645 [Elusimicrobia bacterium RIFCSPHIGHO2_02_FULL_57_9]|nr:MAG: hypothetical protein A3J74_09645 [Elusimicrobia bacterium RIFCSPHIGHO2_02_FULL_57_9]